jgi:hypothetical protein
LVVKVLDASGEVRDKLTKGFRRHRIKTSKVMWTTREEENAQVQVPQEPEMLLPDTWNERRGIRVKDPDGWRNDAKSYYEPITEKEWEERITRSTVEQVVPTLRVPSTNE